MLTTMYLQELNIMKMMIVSINKTKLLILYVIFNEEICFKREKGIENYLLQS